jgi:hypothetical protein
MKIDTERQAGSLVDLSFQGFIVGICLYQNACVERHGIPFLITYYA